MEKTQQIKLEQAKLAIESVKSGQPAEVRHRRRCSQPHQDLRGTLQMLREQNK